MMRSCGKDNEWIHHYESLLTVYGCQSLHELLYSLKSKLLVNLVGNELPFYLILLLFLKIVISSNCILTTTLN